ncbi:MAG: ABC transporter ATP-binding protein [Armatimonadetes bacterium]|nr:ABC transporter ATP-binding protein [Armatimonadota bacterium]
MALVEIENLRKVYPGSVVALADLMLVVEEGEWVAITGPSGSGKSTLLHLLAAMDRPTSGALCVAGLDLGALGPRERARYRRETVGLVFQQYHVIPYLTVLENVMLAQYYHSMPDAVEAQTALEKVGLGYLARRLPSQLSGGELQRVCIARALINHPPLLLADEPTGNLDAANEEIVLDLFDTLHAAGHTLVVVTHDESVAGRAHRRLRLEHGALASDVRQTPAGAARQIPAGASAGG